MARKTQPLSTSPPSTTHRSRPSPSGARDGSPALSFPSWISSTVSRTSSSAAVRSRGAVRAWRDRVCLSMSRDPAGPATGSPGLASTNSPPRSFRSRSRHFGNSRREFRHQQSVIRRLGSQFSYRCELDAASWTLIAEADKPRPSSSARYRCTVALVKAPSPERHHNREAHEHSVVGAPGVG